MSEFRKLQDRLQKIEEGYFKDLDIELQGFRRANKDLMPTELIRLAWKNYGPETAKYLSDQLEMEGDLADYEASDSQPHLREDNLPQFDDLLRAKASMKYQIEVNKLDKWDGSPVEFAATFTEAKKIRTRMARGTELPTSAINITEVPDEETLYDSKINKLEPNYPIVRSKWQKELRKKLADVNVSDYPWSKKKGSIDEGGGDWFKRLNKKEEISQLDKDEDYFKNLDVALQKLRQENSNLSAHQLVRLAHDRFGQEAARDLSDQLEMKGDLADYEASDSQPHLHEDAGINEAIVTVPAELRGNIAMTAHATSGDASKFIKDLDLDDEVSNTIVDPETGEVLFEPGQTKREDMKAMGKLISNANDYNSAQPIMHAGFSRDHERIQGTAYDLLDELRDGDFYHVVWQPISKMVDDPEVMMDKDYDVEYDVPVLLKRKDGRRLDNVDHENIREIIRAVKNASTMQNVGIMFMGTTNNGTTARFMPSFI